MQQCSFDLERVHQNGLRLGTWGPSVKWVECQDGLNPGAFTI